MLLRAGVLLLTGQVATAVADDFEVKRMELVEIIEADVRATSQYLKKDKLDPRVIEAIANVPRHEFVPEDMRDYAYQNRPLPIGHGQTISQPYIVAIMSDLLDIKPEDRVLEIGTGSGYQAAILAQLAKEVYSIEIVDALGKRAAAIFERLGYDNIKTRVGDGYFGWKEAAPFDAIIVTAAAEKVPEPLLEQLKPGGKMIIPVDSEYLAQDLILISVDGNGETFNREILPVQFVPLTGDH